MCDEEIGTGKEVPGGGNKLYSPLVSVTRTKIAFYQDVDSEKECFIIIRRIRFLAHFQHPVVCLL